MKKTYFIVCLLLALTVGLMGFPASFGAELSTDEETIFEFDENYDTFSQDWNVVAGDWKVQDGVLKQTAATAGAFSMTTNYRKKIYGDFTAFMRFKVTEENAGAGWFGFFFRREAVTDTHESSGYGLTVNGINGNPPGKASMIDWTKSFSFEDEVIEVKAGEWNEVAVIVKGNEYYYLFNEDIAAGVVSMYIKDDAHTNDGYIGIGSGNSRIELDYLKIYTGSRQDGLITITEGGGSQAEDPMKDILAGAIRPGSDNTFGLVAGILGIVVALVVAGFGAYVMIEGKEKKK